MKEIPLTQGKVAIVDDEDYELVSKYKWCASHTNGKRWYACRKSNGKSISMHRFITNAPKGSDVDHINNNGLDNRRSNMRVCDRTQNNANRQPKTHGYKGIHLKDKRKNLSKPWAAGIIYKGKRIRLGVFATKEEAADAYDKAAIKYFGEFARTNKSPDS